MNRCRKRSLALAVAVAFTLWVPVVFAAAPPSAISGLWLDHGTAPLSDLLNAWAPPWVNGPDGDGTWSAISLIEADAVTSCPSAAFVAKPLSATTESCPDDESVSPRDLSNVLPLVSAGVPDGDSTGSANSLTWTGAVVLSAPAAAVGAASTATPDPRPDNPPIPPPDWRNIWAPVSAGAPGGSGTWSLASASWTDIYGDAPATMSPRPGFAVFQGTPGTVTVDNSAGAVGVTGMHFTVDGYTLAGGALQLAGSAGSLANIGVGDGNSASAVDRAVINNALTGSAGLNKVDFGWLVLAGNNTYSGGTTISSGILQIGNGGTSGSIIGNVQDNGSLAFDRINAVTYGSVISGTGSLAQSGTGTLTLTGANTYSGGTTINSGALQIGNGGTAGSIVGNVTNNGALIFDRSDTLIFGDVVSGTGALTQEGAGTLILTGDNSYVGSTGIGVGSTLQLGNGNTSGSIAGDVAVGGSLVFDRSDSVIYDGVISGTGSLIQKGAGTLTLTGMSAYQGGNITVEAGRLVLVGDLPYYGLPYVKVESGSMLDMSGVTAYAIVGDLEGSGSVALGGNTLLLSGTTSEFDGVISGSGSLRASGSPVRLGGKNTYTGQTYIGTGNSLTLVGDGSISDSGEVLLDVASTFDISGTNSGATVNTLDGVSGSPLSAVVLGGQTLTVTDGGVFDGIISGTGGLVISGGTLELPRANTYTGLTTIDAGAMLQLGDGFNVGSIASSSIVDNGALMFDWEYGTTPYGAVISGTGSVVVNIIKPGTLQLTGANTYTGGTIINSGTLQSTNPLHGDVTVNSGGALDGVPEVDGNLSNAGSVDVHGGDTTVTGNYMQTATGAFTYLGVSLGSKLAVTGTATINGGTLEITGVDPGYVANTHTDVLTATGGVTGTFSNLLKVGAVFTSSTIGYGPNDVYLDTTGLSITVAAAAMGIADAPSMAAAQRVQAGFEAINASMASGGAASPDVLQGAGAIQHSATPAVAQATLTSLSGQLHAASAAMLFDGIDAGSNALSEHFDDLASGRAKSGVWYGDLGWQGNLQRGGYAGATFRSDGGVTGADTRIGAHGVFGFAVGQSRGFGQLDASWDHGRTWMNSLAMYGGVVNGPWYASAQIGGGWYREDMQRMLQLGALMAPVGNASTGRYIAGALEGGRVFHIDGTCVVPFADVRYQSLDLGSFIEQGGLGYGLEGEGHTVGRSQAGLGLRVERGWRLANGMRMAFDGSAGWQHTLHQRGDVFNASFTGFNDWLPVEGIGLSRNTMILRAGVLLWPTSNFGLRLGYMREQDQRERAGSAMLQGTVAF